MKNNTNIPINLPIIIIGKPPLQTKQDETTFETIKQAIKKNFEGITHLYPESFTEDDLFYIFSKQIELNSIFVILKTVVLKILNKNTNSNIQFTFLYFDAHNDDAAFKNKIETINEKKDQHPSFSKLIYLNLTRIDGSGNPKFKDLKRINLDIYKQLTNEVEQAFVTAIFTMEPMLTMIAKKIKSDQKRNQQSTQKISSIFSTTKVSKKTTETIAINEITRYFQEIESFTESTSKRLLQNEHWCKILFNKFNELLNNPLISEAKTVIDKDHKFQDKWNNFLEISQNLLPHLEKLSGGQTLSLSPKEKDKLLEALKQREEKPFNIRESLEKTLLQLNKIKFERPNQNAINSATDEIKSYNY